MCLQKACIVQHGNDVYSNHFVEAVEISSTKYGIRQTKPHS